MKIRTILAIAALGLSTSVFAQAQIYAHNVPDDEGQPRMITPNDWEKNADGIGEDPDHPMSGKARAFRNGWVNRGYYDADHPEEFQRFVNNRHQPKSTQVAQNTVPLPTDGVKPPLPQQMPQNAPQQVKPKGYAGYPAAANQEATEGDEDITYVQPRRQQRRPQYVQQQQPPVVVNVVPQPDPRYYEPAEQFGRAPSYRNQDEYSEQAYYDAQPQPVVPVPMYRQPDVVYVEPPVYQQPPVVIQGAVRWGRPMGYVPRIPPRARYGYPMPAGGAYRSSIGVQFGYTRY